MHFSFKDIRQQLGKGKRQVMSTWKWHTSRFSMFRRMSKRVHPWFYDFKARNVLIPADHSDSIIEGLPRSCDLASPILFLARGHSGTAPLARILAAAGVYIGDSRDRHSMNATLDSLYWVFGFQRTLLPQLFRYGVGCFVNESLVMNTAFECLRRHLTGYVGGPWGFKTCDGMFCHPLYRFIFPRAKYIYLVRDGRDVILSGNGYFQLADPSSRYIRRYWDNFKILTFGISDDFASCSFRFPEKPSERDEVMGNRFWIQAKSWREHVLMVENLRRTKGLSPSVHTVKYEQLCRDPIPVLQRLFQFLEIELTPQVKDSAVQLLHSRSIERWKNYPKFISGCEENMESVFSSMQSELEVAGYLE